MSKILNFENFIRENEMYEAQAPMRTIIPKTAAGKEVKFVTADPDTSYEIEKGKIYVALSPSTPDQDGGIVKFEFGPASIIFTSNVFDPSQIGILQTTPAPGEKPLRLLSPDQINKAAYGLLWHIAARMSGGSNPGKEDFADALKLMKMIKTDAGMKALSSKNKHFNSFYSGLVTNSFDPSQAIGSNTFAKIPVFSKEIGDNMKAAAAEVKFGA